jgi:hypothetical protein
MGNTGKYEVIYTRHSQGWTAEQVSPTPLSLSGPTLAGVREAIRAANLRDGLDSVDLAIEELVEAGESHLVRLS